MSYPLLATKLYNAPLLIAPGKLEVLEHVFRAWAEGNPIGAEQDAVEAREIELSERIEMFRLAAGGSDSVRRTDGGYYMTQDGLALIQVLGSLVQRSAGMDAMSGIESYGNIGAKLQAAFNDPRVQGILLEIDSDGGQVAGCFELASMIRSIDATKPVTAHANEKAFSAAYALASSAGELMLAPTGMVGSVGVRMLHVDQSNYDAKRGMVYTPIYAGERKGDFSPHAALSDEAHAVAQDMVDRTYATFVDHVAAMRNMDAKTVRDTEAGVLHPDQALKNGMIDSVGRLGDALQSLRGRVTEAQKVPVFPGHKRHQRAANADKPKEQDMATEDANKITADALAAARAEGFKEAQQASQNATALGAKAEQERIAGILAHPEAVGRKSFADYLAFKTTNSVEAAGEMLKHAGKEASEASANPLAEGMAKRLANKPGPDQEQKQSAAGAPRLDVNAIYARRRQAVANANLRSIK